MNKQRILNPRPSGTREVSKKFLIMVEGTTEYNYFRRFVKRNSKLKVKPLQSKRRDAVSIAEACIKKSEEYGISKKDGDRSAVVYDVDQNTGDSISKSEEICKRNGAEMYISNPSFECWLLMHFQDVGGGCTQDSLEDSLTVVLGCRYEKSNEINGKIDDTKIREAISRSSKRICIREKRNKDCLKTYPSSTLHFLVGDILDP